jgi:hypothetical protein
MGACALTIPNEVKVNEVYEIKMKIQEKTVELQEKIKNSKLILDRLKESRIKLAKKNNNNLAYNILRRTKRQQNVLATLKQPSGSA